MKRKILILSAILLAQNLIFAGCAKKEVWKTIGAADANSAPAAPTPRREFPKSEIKSGGFQNNIPADFEMPADAVGRKILKEYGALFVARGGATPPNAVVFKTGSEVADYQSGVESASETVGGVKIELQAAAMEALKAAAAEARRSGAAITPRGTDAARRSYSTTVELWESRVNPGLAYWSGKGRISAADASRIKSLAPSAQVAEIFRLEEEGMFFARDLSKSIMYSVAPPGASQHLSMLALDVSEYENPKVREILARHGWFQTVVSDLPHFTFLGASEADLPRLGLKKVSSGGRVFWVPDI